MSLLNYNSSEPKRSGEKKTLSIILGIGLLVGTIALGSTLAASINLNNGGPVEFGQGIARTVACSGSQSLTITPLSTFVNSNGSGVYKFSGIRVDNIPNTCRDKEFTFSAYNNESDASAMALFNTSISRAVVYMTSDDTFEVGGDETGFSVTTNLGTSFTVIFTAPVALATDVYEITVESATPLPGSCSEGGACVLGDTGPGGGTVFYVSSTPFTVTDSPCGSSCRYFEWAPNGWAGGGATQDPILPWSSDTTNLLGTTGTAIGTGFANTQKILTSNPPYEGAVSGSAFVVASYGGGGKSDWFLPSIDELDEMAIYASATSLSGFAVNHYQSSSERVYSPETTRSWVLRMNERDRSDSYKFEDRYTRPIRAF